MSRRCRFARACMSALAVIAWSPSGGSADTFLVEVDNDQRVTIEGQSPSLKSLVEDLCYRAGVQLLSFDAQDRPARMKVATAPFHELLARLLKSESFVVGYRKGAPGQPARVAWLRVLGDNTTAIANRSAGGSGARIAGFQPPPALVESAFAAGDPQEQQEAMQTLSTRIMSDPAELRRFLSAESGQIAVVLRQWPNSADLLQQVRQSQTDPAVITKLDEILAELKRE